jgi:WD40 repeat protein
MSNSYQPEDIAVYNQRSLKKLIRSITNSQGHFALILARCNYCSLRDQTVQQIKEECQVEIRELHLSKSIKTLYTTIEANLGDQLPQALMIFGLELVDAIDHVLISTNQVREEFRKNFQFPIVIWVNDEVFQKLLQLMPDFKSWTGNSIKFKIATNELINNLHQIVNSLFVAILKVGAGKFLDNVSLNLDLGILHLSEIESAVRTLQVSTEKLEPELEASLQFLLGREADASGHKSEARDYYEQSLAVWENKISGQTNILSDDLKRYGCLLWHLGLWWRQYATLHRSEYHEACLKAKDYFQKCVEAFQQYDYPDLAAKFINAWGEVLTRLEAWDELEKVALVAIKLHQTYPEPIRLAYSYGFMAEVVLKKSQWVEAKEYAELALETNANISSDQTINWEWERKYYKNLYFLLLAEAQENLNQVTKAIANLETARSESNPQHDPLLYIRILARLRSLYFDQGNYLEAFQVKLEQRSIEQQYGLRAFVGAGRLQSKLQVINPALTVADPKTAVTQEITASGRMQDVNRLIERISRDDHKLTVIYGQSGVGKSSLVQAGLLPALKQRAIAARDVVPVLLQVYTDWAKVLGSRFVESLEEVRGLSFPVFLDSMAGFVEELNKNIDKGLLTVLIFDQFEEFFFAYKDQDKRIPFFEFIRDCLNIPYVKIILSLREDYLHYLLECNRLTHLDAIDNNILDKKILYYLGNFSPEDARSVIQSLTESSQFYLEPPLIDELVRDLARDFNEIRPIELQVVGAQLQTEKITTLVQYQEQGPKEKLVGRFLEEVVKDCGNNNEQFAKLVLYLLTDENNTRPLKTRAELEADLALEPTRLDLILKILVKSGLVFQVPGFPADRYQLVHDYLVPFVREQQSARLIAELEKEKEQRKLTEAKLNQVLTQQLRTARRQTVTLIGFIAAISVITVGVTVAYINTSLTSEISSKDDIGLDELVSAIKVGKKLKLLSMGAIPETRLQVLSNLSHAIKKIKEINRIEGYDKKVTTLSFSQNSKMLATASEDGRVKILSIRDGKENILPGHKLSVTSVSFSPNGKMLATASEDGTAKIWSIPEGKLVTTLKGHKGGVNFVKFSPNGQLLATASKDKTVKIWKRDGREINTLAVSSNQNVIVSFSPDNQIVATGGRYDTVKLWNLQEKQPKSTEIEDFGTVTMNFSKDGDSISLFNKQGNLKFWYIRDRPYLIKSFENACKDSYEYFINASVDSKFMVLKQKESEKELYQTSVGEDYCSPSIIFKHDDRINYASFSPDGKLLASASQDGVVKIWDIDYKNPSFKRTDTDTDKNRNTKISFSFDGKTVALGSDNKSIELQNRDGTHIKTIQGDSSILSFSPDNQTLATGSPDDILKLWKLDSKKEITLKGSTNRIVTIDFSPDGNLVAAASTDNLIRLWRSSDGKFIRLLKGQIKQVTNLSFSPDGQILATISDDNKVQLWNSRDGSLIKLLEGHNEKVTSIRFSHDSKLLATIGDDNLVKLYKSNGTLIKKITEHNSQVTNVEFSRDDRKLMSVSPKSGEIKLWDSSNGNAIKSIDNYGMLSAEFSRNGDYITSINQNYTVKLWTVEGELPLILKGHNDRITKVDFSSDGAMITTSSADNTVKLWDRKGKKLRTLQEHTKGVNDISFSPNGKLIASASADNTVKLWSTSNGKIFTTLKGFNYGINDDMGIDQVNFSSDGKILSTISYKYKYSYGQNCSYGYNYIVKFWSIDNNVKLKELKPLKGHINIPCGNNIGDFIRFSRDYKTVAFASKDDSLKLWSLKGDMLAILPGHTDSVNSVTFSPDSKIIASASDDTTVKLWDINGKLLKPILRHGDKVNSVSFKHDGKTIASASDDKTIKLWNLDGKLLKTIFDTDKITNVRFQANDKIIAFISGSAIKLWNSDNQKAEALKSDSSSSGSLSFDDRSQMLAVGVENTNLYLLNSWFAKAPSLLYPISSFSGDQFSSNGQTIAVTSNEGKIYLNDNLDDLLKRACKLASGYLKNNRNVGDSDRSLCDDINTQ